MFAAWYYATIYSPSLRALGRYDWRRRRALVASILVFASGCADIPALLAWSLPGEWVLVPFQIAVCLVAIGVLIAPERWFAR